MEVVKESQKTPEKPEEFIEKLRRDYLKDFLDERYIREYLARCYNVRDLSNVKIEFMKKDFKELMSTSLEPSAIEALLSKLQNLDNADEEEEKERIFRDEIEKVVMRYLF